MDNKEQLVDQIKTLQRSDVNAKQAWCDFSDTQLGGVRDPSKQDAMVLQNFLQLYSNGGIGATREAARAFRASPPTIVDRIKILQKSDPNAKQAWVDFCDTQLGGVKDPNRHDATVLENFLQLYQNGGIGAIQGAARRQAASQQWNGGGQGWGTLGGQGGWGMQMGSPPMSFPDFVKTGQKTSDNWRAAWVTYCAVYGRGKYDPAKHDDNFTKGFVDYIGELAHHSLAAVAQQNGVQLEGNLAWPGSSSKRPLGGAAMPTAKRQNMGFGAVDPNVQELASRVKALQKVNPQAKEAWAQYCDGTAGGVKDPSRHEAGSLQRFLASYE